MRTAKLITCSSLLLLVSTLDVRAANYRVIFQGSQARAIQSSLTPRAAGYLGTAASYDPANLSGPAASPRQALNAGAGTPNQIVTFLHPYTNQAITVPLTLPVGRPRIVTRSDRIIYNYGLFSHRVVVKFLRNGQVEVNYRG